MRIFEAQLDHKEQWDSFLRDNEMGSFLQSWTWGDFMRDYRKARVWRFVVADGERWLGVMFLYMGRLKLGLNYISSPRGPVVGSEAKDQKLKVLELLMATVDEIARQESSLYVQVEPYTEDTDWVEDLRSLQLVKARDNVMPRYTLIMDIADDPEVLLKQMHHKTRYNIRLAKKKEVRVVIDNERVDDFYALLMETSRRQGVSFFSQSYFQALVQQPNVKLYLAEYDGDVVAANIMLWWDDMATYLFGGSGLKHRNVMAPHLLQWQAILDAREAGLKRYDFWGAVPEGVSGKEKKWAGVTRFKKGFCPDTDITSYLGTYEKIYRPRALNAYKVARRLMGG